MVSQLECFPIKSYTAKLMKTKLNFKSPDNKLKSKLYPHGLREEESDCPTLIYRLSYYVVYYSSV